MVCLKQGCSVDHRKVPASSDSLGSATARRGGQIYRRRSQLFVVTFIISVDQQSAHHAETILTDRPRIGPASFDSGQCIRARLALQRAGLIIMPVDRDIHRSVVCSRQCYLSRLRSLFVSDTTRYARPSDTIASVLARWRHLYAANGWQRYGKWSPRGMLGYAYCFPKAKDLTRSRVIVPCAAHPMQQALSRAGRALTHLLTRAKFCAYNLPSVQQLQDPRTSYSHNAL